MKTVLPLYVDATGDWAIKGVGPEPDNFNNPWFCYHQVQQYFSIPRDVREVDLVISDKPLGKDAYKVKLVSNRTRLFFLDTSKPEVQSIVGVMVKVLKRKQLTDKVLYIRIDY